MERIRFRFYAGLNDFLPPARRHRDFEHTLLLPTPVKDAIESAGVPHPEIDLILVNGESADFARTVKDGDRVAAYPAFHSTDISGVTLVRPPPPREPAFLLDGHLGTLARYLRMLGFDSAWQRDPADEDLARRSAEEDRILLTRDRGLLMRAIVRRGAFVRATDPRQQLAEIAARFNLAPAAAPFSRCMKCNVLLEHLAPEAVATRVPRGVLEKRNQFQACPACRRVYWTGSHHARMSAMLGDLLK
jgi:hypothetical protein